MPRSLTRLAAAALLLAAGSPLPAAHAAGADCPLIEVLPLDTPIGFPGAPYNVFFTQSGGAHPVTFSVAGTLPPMFSFLPSGLLQGRTGLIDHWPIVVTARDANGCTGSRAYDLTITNVISIYAQSGMVVDPAGNSVLDPGEAAVVAAPAWRNISGGARNPVGEVVSFTGPVGAQYLVLDGNAAYGVIANGATGSCLAAGDCYAVYIPDPPARPTQHWHATLGEHMTPFHSGEWTLHVGGSFGDVGVGSPYYTSVEALFHRGVTGGCLPGLFCPRSETTRAQMAAFVLRAREGPGFLPPPCGGAPLFVDVDPADPFCPWIEELARRQVVAGCGGGRFCPGDPVTREQAALVALRTLEVHPFGCGVPLFEDVPASSPFCPWIEELARRGVVAGCSVRPPLFCPSGPVPREQMAAVVAGTFGLKPYGP